MIRWLARELFNPVNLIAMIVGIVAIGWARGYWDLPFLPSRPTPATVQIDQAFEELSLRNNINAKLLMSIKEHRYDHYEDIRYALIQTINEAARKPGATQLDVEQASIDFWYNNQDQILFAVWGYGYEIPDALLSRTIELQFKSLKYSERDDVDTCVSLALGNGAVDKNGRVNLPRSLRTQWVDLLFDLIETPRLTRFMIATPNDIKAWRSDQPDKYISALRFYAAAPEAPLQKKALCKAEVDLFTHLVNTGPEQQVLIYRGMLAQTSLAFN